MAEVKDMDQDLFDDSDAIDVEATEITNETSQDDVAVEEESTSEELAMIDETPKAPALEGLDLDFSSLANTLPGVVVGNTGLQVTRFPVERAKFTKSNRALISILSDQVIVAKTHYDEDRGSFLCFGGKCCDNDLARVRYVFPIVQYSTDPKGKPIVNRDNNGKPISPVFDIQNKSLCIGQDTYDALLAIQDLNGGSLSGLDLLVSCSDEQFQKLSIQNAGPARFTKDKNLVASINEFWKQNSKHILKAIAKKITPEEYEAEAAADIQAGAEVDFDDVFK